MALEFKEEADAIIPQDTPPPTTDNTAEMPRRPRGRPPGSKNSTSTSTPRRSTKSTDLANAAADVLVQTNSMIGVVAGFTGYSETQDAIVEKQDMFRDMAVKALLGDPELCKQILAGGGVSSKVSLIMAYALFASYVGPTAMNEFKEKSEARKARRQVELDTGEAQL